MLVGLDAVHLAAEGRLSAFGCGAKYTGWTPSPGAERVVYHGY